MFKENLVLYFNFIVDDRDSDQERISNLNPVLSFRNAVGPFFLVKEREENLSWNVQLMMILIRIN